MATTVGQHSVATFTSPVNGTTPIDANTVRGNDNTMRTAYVDHDADPGIHVQSSTLASRPVAGTAGRKWITEDSGVYTLWFDDGTNWHPVSSENVALTVLATTALNKGDVVKIVGWNNGQDLPEVAKVASSSDIAFAVMSANATINTMGYAVNTGIVQDVATAAYSVGTQLYPSSSGGFTSTKPTSGLYQVVAYVLRANVNGVLYVEFSAPRIVERSDNTASTLVLRDSNGDFAAGTITATAVNATTLDLTNLEVTNIKAKDGTQAIAIADSTGKLTISDGVLLSGLTASQAVFTDSSKNLVSNAITGTGNVVMSASPTLTGTVSAAALTTTGNTYLATSSGSVGIATTSPAKKLDVVGGDNDGLQYRTSTRSVQIGQINSEVAIAWGSGTPLTFFSAIERMRIDANGVIGIGVTPSAWGSGFRAIEMGDGDTMGALTVNAGSSSGNVNLFGNAYYDGTNFVYKYSAAAGRYALNGASHLWFNAPSGTAGATVSFTQAMTLDANGNLGLGVTPSAWGSNWRAVELQYSTSGQAFAALYPIIAANTYNDNTNYIYKTTAAASYYSQVLGQHRWYNAPSGTAGNAISFTQAMTLDASGQLALGTATASATLGRNITMNGTNAGTNTGVILSSAGVERGYIYGNDTQIAVGSITSIPTVFTTANTERARIASNGKFTVSSSISGDVIANLVNQAANSFGLRVAGGDGGNYVASFNDYNVVERLRIDSPTTAGQTALLLWDVDNGTLERVTVGAADSGGTGFKVLRIPN